VKRRVFTLAAVAVTLGTAITGAAAGHGDVALSADRHGNPALLRAAPALLDEGGTVRHFVSIAYVERDRTAFAQFGSDQRTEFEIASITKTFTGELLADAISRGLVTRDTKVGSLLPRLAGAPIASVTLAELATYRSGLGLWGDDSRDGGLRTWWARHVLAANPHQMDLDEMYDRVRRDPLKTRGHFHYSNISPALLGHALAAAAHTDYETLLRERLLIPLAMTATRVGRSTDHNQTRGYTGAGRLSAPWNLGALEPAGGLRSNIADMSRYARGLLLGEIVGIQALDRQSGDVGPDGTGFGWYTKDVAGHPVAWKTGETGGFASMIVVDRVRGRAVVILTDTAESVEKTAFALLEQNLR
jgi:CubicO group peptidase (beta-lactamase class C family)